MLKNLTLKQLRTILAASKEKRLNLAAKKLDLTPAAVTLQIKQIEEEANVTLFYRNKNSLILTEFGEVYLLAAQEVEQILDKLSDKINHIKKSDPNSLRCGVTITGEYLENSLISLYRQQFPDVTFSLVVGNRAELFRKLELHELDVIIAGRPPSEFATRSIVLGEHPLLIIAHPDHALAKGKSIPKKQLNQQHFFVREVGSGVRATLDFFLSDLLIDYAYNFSELKSNEAIKQAVLSGGGIALISSHVVTDELKQKQLVALDVEGTPIIKQWFIISHINKFKKEIINHFEKFLLKHKATSFL